MIIYAQNLLKF